MVTDGHNVNGGPRGHFLIGPNNIFAGHYTTTIFNATRTDMSGQATGGSPYFNNGYYVTDLVNGGSYQLNPDINLLELVSYEFSNGNGFAVSGAWRDDANNRHRIFHTRLNPDGTVPPGSPFSNGTVYISPGDYFQEHVVDVIESQVYPDRSYICGYVSTYDVNTQINEVYPFIIAVNETLPVPSAPTWSYIYDLDDLATGHMHQPYGIAENPLTGELVMAGRYSTLTEPGDGFTARINGNNGSINPLSVNYYGDPGSREGFTCIKASNNAAIGSVGQNYVVGGLTDVNGSDDFWIGAIDGASNMVWSYTYDYVVSGAPNNDFDECSDILERQNPYTGNFEYYMAGITFAPNTIDRVVVKTDGNGQAWPNGQFTYPKYEADYLSKIDMFDGAGLPNDVDGISLFGSTSWHPGFSLGNWDFSLIKAYFNGITACDNQTIETPIDVAYTPGTYTTTGQTSASFSPGEFYYGWDFPLLESKVCLATSVAGGDNREPNDDLVGLDENHALVSNFYPSYITSSTSEVRLEGFESFSGRTDISVVDASGRLVWQHSYEVSNTQETILLDVSSFNQKSGTYLVQVRNADHVQTHRLMVGAN